MNTNVKAYSRWTRRLRREAHNGVLFAALLVAVPAFVWAQPTPYPILRYPGAPANLQGCPGPYCYQVQGFGGISTNALQYSVSSGSTAWSDLTTVFWRNINATFSRIPSIDKYPPNTTPSNQRWSYKFYLDETRCPTWDQPCQDPDGVHKPRIEFDSAVSANQLACDPGGTWENVGVISESTSEKIFTWSMWLPQDPAWDPVSGTRRWCTLNQAHFGGPGSPPYCNWSTVSPCDEAHGHPTVDCNPWPVVGSNNVVFDPTLFPLPLFFHTNRRDDYDCNIGGTNCSIAEPPRMWTMNLPDSYGQWVDFAMYIKPSTQIDGRYRLWVNGTEVNGSPLDGNVFYQFLDPHRPYYYVKQGYYRHPLIRDQAQGGVTVYMTPMMVTSPSQPALRR
jgi:hypothetical protein